MPGAMSKTISPQLEHTISRQCVVRGTRSGHLQHKPVDNPRKIFEKTSFFSNKIKEMTRDCLISSQRHVVTIPLLASRSLHFDNVNQVNITDFESEPS